MKIKPIYPKEVTSNPFYVGIIIGFLIAIGSSIIIFTDTIYSVLYGVGLMGLGILYYYYKHKEFI
jgi:predicted permease